MIFTLTNDELLFLRAFCEAPVMHGFEDITSSEQLVSPEKVLESLTGKGYLLKNEGGEYELREELTFLMKVAVLADAAFVLELSGRKLAAYFKEDAITMITEENDEVKWMWLPFIPLLIGAVAEFIGSTKATLDIEERTCSLSEIGRCREELKADGFKKIQNTTFYKDGIQLGDGTFEVYGNGSAELTIKTVRSEVRIVSQRLEGRVNDITEIIAPLHAHAIRKGVLK